MMDKVPISHAHISESMTKFEEHKQFLQRSYLTELPISGHTKGTVLLSLNYRAVG